MGSGCFKNSVHRPSQGPDLCLLKQALSCGCSCPNAQWTCSGRQEPPPQGPHFSWKEMPTEQFPLRPQPDPTGRFSPITLSPTGQVLCQSCLQRPLSPQGGHPSGVSVGMTEEKHDREMGYNTQEREAETARGQPQHLPPEYCCVVPGDKDLGMKGQEKPDA